MSNDLLKISTYFTKIIIEKFYRTAYNETIDRYGLSRAAALAGAAVVQSDGSKKGQG